MIRQKTIRVTLLPPSELESIQQEALEFAGIGLYRYRFDGTILFMDRGAFRIFNLEGVFPDPVSVIGRNISEVFTYTGPKELLRKEIRKHRHLRGFEYRFKTLSGIDKVALNDSYLVKDPKSGQEVIQVVMFDITERKKAEEQLRQVLTSARCILWHATVTEHDNDAFEWQINVSNEDAAEELLPLKRRSGQKYSDVWHERITPEDRKRMDFTSTDAMHRDLPGYIQEFRCERADGQIRWLSEQTHIHRLGPRKWFIVGVCTDITERKRVEEALRKSEARYRAVVEDQPDLICRFNPDTILTFVNESYCRYYGKRRDELIGHSFMSLVPVSERENVKRAYTSLTPEHPVITYAFPVALPDGRMRWQQWTDRAIFDERGRFIEYQSSGADVTEQKEAEHRHRAFSAGLRAVVAIADELISCPDLDSLYKRAVERAREKLGIERCAIFVREGPDLRGTYGTDLKGHTSSEHIHRFPTQTDWLERIQALRPQDRRMIVIEQPYVEVGARGAVEHEKGWIAITPIQSATDFLGVFSNDTAITRQPMDDTKQEIVSVFCSLLGAIIERKRGESKQAAISEGLRAVVAIADELISCPDPDSICRRTVELAREKLNLNRCAIFLRDGDVLRGTYGTNLNRETTDEHNHRVDPYPDWLKHFQAMRPEDRQVIIHEEAYTEWASGKVVRFGKGWVALTPIQSADSFVGMFSNDTAISHSPVDETQQEIVTVLCSLLGAILERKRAEERLRKAHDDLEVRVHERTAELTRVNEYLKEIESRQKAILNNIPDIAWLKDREGRFIAANEPFAKACGVPPDQLVGKTDFDIWPKDLAGRYRDDDEDVMRTRKRRRFEEPIAAKDGTMSWIETIKTPVFNERDEVIGTTGIARDITERKQVEEILRRSHDELEKLVRERTHELEDANATLKKEIAERKRIEEEIRRLAIVVEQEAEAVVISDTSGRIQYVNPAFEKMSGYARDEVIGHNPRLLKSGKQDHLFYARMWQTLTHGEVWSGHLSNKRKDGSLYDVEAVISPIRDESGQIVSYVATTRDVTREMQLEEQFRQAQKMEAIGRLAGGIAHDFNNLLTSILGYSRLVTDEIDEGNPMRADMEEIIHAGERAAALTKQLLAFSRKQMIQLRPTNINAVVLDMDKLLRRTLGEDIELVTLIDNEMGCINADAGLIEQAVMNLAVNARDAMPKGGSLTIQTATVPIDEKQCRERVNVEPGEYIMISVRDTGTGMSKEIRDHCLEPFFTTKEKGKGTGLGLSIVYSIVKQFGGFIDIETSTATGTDIRMYLPAVEASVCEIAAREKVALPRGNETILVVEDEETVRRLAVRILESLGYQVLQARHGGEALLICERYEKPIHLILSDVVMPHIGGQELIERLRQIRQDFRVLYMSGFTDESFVRNSKDGREAELLLKPFTQESLAVRVRQSLDRKDEKAI